MEAPERIYLQAGMTEEDEDWDDEVGVTWCIDQINDSDVEYVRRDVAAKLWATLDSWGLSICEDLEIPDKEFKAGGKLLDETAWLADSPNAENGESE